MKQLLGMALLLILLSVHAVADNTAEKDEVVSSHENTSISLDLFLTTSCPHCQKADAFFSEQERELPWLKIRRFYIDQDKAALLRLRDRIQKDHSQNFSVPAFIFCQSHWIGFSHHQDSGRILLDALTYCRNQIHQEGKLTLGTVNVLRKWSVANRFNIDAPTAKSPVKFVFTSALLDGFTPCSLFVFAVFMAFLWLYARSRHQQLYVGMISILSLGVVHFLNFSYFTQFYYFIPQLRYPAAVLGVVLLYFISLYFRKTVLKGEPASLLMSVFLIPLTLFVVFMYQQNCAMEVGLIFQQWLNHQHLSQFRMISYQLFYHLFYLLPYIIIMILYRLFGHKKRFPLYHKALNIAGSFILATIAIILAIHPVLLANFLISCTVIIFALLIGWLMARVYG